MKIFISSLIGGMTDARRTVREAVETLGHEAVMAEDFEAGPASPQIACLSGLRSSAAVILILGDQYGDKQASGLSPTHEEYREAKGSRPVFVFRSANGNPESDQAAFIAEVEGWEAGFFRGTYASNEELKAKVTRALHQWEVSRAASPLDSEELLTRAIAQIPEENRGFSQSGVSLLVSIASGPTQTVLRPSEIERPGLKAELMKEALFGENQIFDPKLGSDSGVKDHALTVFQDNGGSFVRVTGQGDITIKLSTARSKGDFIVIEEDAEKLLRSAVRYAAWLLDRIDPTQRLSHVAVVATLRGGDMVVWRTQAEQNSSPNSYSMGMHQREPAPVTLSPPHRSRSAFALDVDRLAEDLITLIRRQVKG